MSNLKTPNVGWVIIDDPQSKDRTEWSKLVKVRVHEISPTDQRMICPMVATMTTVVDPSTGQRGMSINPVLPTWALVPKGSTHHPEEAGKVFVKMDNIVAWEWEGLDEKAEGHKKMH